MRPERFVLRWRDRAVEVEVLEESSQVRVRAAGREFLVSIRPVGPNVYATAADGRRWLVHFASEGDRHFLHLDGETHTFAREVSIRGPEPEPSGQDVRAPMPGVVTRILVQTGQVVERGEPLYVLEAMKMESVMRAPGRARVVAIRVEPGTQVAGGAAVVELERLP
ncbi:MAG: biotin/lipoyl-containing protein [Armatimonadota bacterium]|nr:biotin/lipoyl-containing protein [Armatimonadota bacterium]MDR7439209.1 biotin/lipoyl-containing protein [Armatimonadota bacterium]MDR7563685.1 biotin/lipoyl-containing protein [Armatimonadota bacterium]MDR7568591.1 biotin/lipoyl-containing protein [Armatimonadota bacterium]MDR7602005.1 biotin/lipoyl-containing protein [Armatimonadota bacterium]